MTDWDMRAGKWRANQTIAIILGPMKAGTTSLHRLLSEHPSVVRCAPSKAGSIKEPNYFSRGRQKNPNNIRSYRELWPRRTWRKVFLEASTSFTKCYETTIAEDYP